MAVSQTTRLNIYRWSAGSDPFTRAQMDTSHEELELSVAGYSQAGARPAASAAYKGFFHYSAGGQLSYCNGSSWDNIAVENTTDSNIGEIDGTASAGTSASGLAYAEHKHSIAAGTITNSHIVGLDASKLTGILDAALMNDDTITGDQIISIPAAKIVGEVSQSGNAESATQLLTARLIGGVSFNGTADIDLPGVNTTGTQNTDGNAATATDATNASKVLISSDGANAARNVVFTDGTTTGNKSVNVDSGLTYNPSSNTLTAGEFVGAVTGNVTGDVTGTLSGNVVGNVEGNLTGNVTGDVSGSSGSTSFATSAGSASTAGTVTLTQTSTNANHYVTFSNSTSGTDSARTDAGLQYNPSSNHLTVSGNITGGNFYGAVVDVSSYISADGTVRAGDGSQTYPAFAFNNDTNTGMYRYSENQLGLAAGGVQCLIAAAGTVNTAGLATTSTTGYKAVYRNNTYGTLYHFSSRAELKENITNVTASDAGAWIDALQPVTFNERWLQEGDEPPDNKAWREADVQVGFVADDVFANSTTAKFASVEDVDGTLKGVSWKFENVIAAAVAELKSLRERVAALES